MNFKNDNTKACPLISACIGSPEECHGGYCAWYDPFEDCCAILQIALALGEMNRGITTYEG